MVKKGDGSLSKAMKDAVQVSGQIKDRTDKRQSDKKFTCQLFVKQNRSKTASIMEENAHAEDADGQSELNRVLDGKGDASGISSGLFFRDDGKQHSGDGGGDRIGEHQEGQCHTGENAVHTEGFRSREAGFSQT